jgi:hypothetical protein
VELAVSNVKNIDDVQSRLTQISSNLPEVSVSDVNVNENKVSFNISKQGTEDLDAKEVGPQIKQLIESMKLPFEVHGKVVVNEMWSW